MRVRCGRASPARIEVPTLALTGALDGCMDTRLHDTAMRPADFPRGLRVERIRGGRPLPAPGEAGRSERPHPRLAALAGLNPSPRRANVSGMVARPAVAIASRSTCPRCRRRTSRPVRPWARPSSRAGRRSRCGRRRPRPSISTAPSAVRPTGRATPAPARSPATRRGTGPAFFPGSSTATSTSTSSSGLQGGGAGFKRDPYARELTPSATFPVASTASCALPRPTPGTTRSSRRPTSPTWSSTRFTWGRTRRRPRATERSSTSSRSSRISPRWASTFSSRCRSSSAR